MDYLTKVARVSAHLEEHPNDYQSAISLLKAKSDYYESERRKRQIAKLKKIAECRRILAKRSENDD